MTKRIECHWCGQSTSGSVQIAGMDFPICSVCFTLQRHTFCEPCLDIGERHKAKWVLPQSTNKGKTVHYVCACNGHYEGWWDGSNWDGRHLEKKITARKTR